MLEKEKLKYFVKTDVCMCKASCLVGGCETAIGNAQSAEKRAK